MQVNGKLRGKIRMPADADQERSKRWRPATRRVAEYLAGKQVVKVVFVPGRLLSFVVK